MDFGFGMIWVNIQYWIKEKTSKCTQKRLTLVWSGIDIAYARYCILFLMKKNAKSMYTIPCSFYEDELHPNGNGFHHLFVITSNNLE